MEQVTGNFSGDSHPKQLTQQEKLAAIVGRFQGTNLGMLVSEIESLYSSPAKLLQQFDARCGGCGQIGRHTIELAPGERIHRVRPTDRRNGGTKLRHRKRCDAVDFWDDSVDIHSGATSGLICSCDNNRTGPADRRQRREESK